MIKPCIIVCTETWNLEHYEYFNIPGYNMYYNNSKINISDGLVIYVSGCITGTTEVLTIYNLKIINSKIEIEKNNEIMIYALCRSLDISKTEFLLIFKNLINNNSKHKNNLIIGDFNFDITNRKSINQEFLHILCISCTKSLKK